MANEDLDELRIVGGHPALDLANTLAPRLPDGVDYLGSPSILLAWARRTGLLDQAEAARVEQAWAGSPGAAESALADVLTLRALIDPALAGRDLDALSWRWAEAIGRSRLIAGGADTTPLDATPLDATSHDSRLVAGGAARLDIGTEPTLLIADRLADAVVDLVRYADRGRLRSCPLSSGGCGWLFLDRSRNGSRRWCSMDDCGTVVKSRRLTERRRRQR